MGSTERNHFKKICKEKPYLLPLVEGTYMNTSDNYHLKFKFYIGVNWSLKTEVE